MSKEKLKKKPSESLAKEKRVWQNINRGWLENYAQSCYSFQWNEFQCSACIEQKANKQTNKKLGLMLAFGSDCQALEQKKNKYFEQLS